MPLQPEDYEAIRNLYGRYSIAVDTGDLDAYVDCFTPDARYSFEGLPDDLGRNRPHIGHEELRALGASISGGTLGHVLHNQAALTIEGDGDEAHVNSIDHVVRRGQAPHSGSILTGHSKDTVVRSGDRWVYKIRVGYVDVHEATPAPTDELVAERDKFVHTALTPPARS